MESNGLKTKTLLTILGPVNFSRSMFQCPKCKKVRFLGDEELDVVGTSRSPSLRRMMARAGSRATFKEGCEDLAIYAGIKTNAKDVERVAERIGHDMEQWAAKERGEMLHATRSESSEKTIPVMYISVDGTGVPMTKQELIDRKGKQDDGSSKTREVKLGCVFTQTTVDEEGFAVRDPESTTFVGAIENSEAFGRRIYAEAVRRGLFNAQRTVVLGDGAEWIKTMVDTHFIGSTQIIDLYHTREHVSDLCKILFPHQDNKIIQHRIRWWTDLDEGAVEKIVREARELLPSNIELKEKAEKEIAYLDKNQQRMSYRDFRDQGLFVGSGVIEAGCKTVIGQRLKQSGMKWSLRGANAMISLRSTIKSGRFEDFWEDRIEVNG